MRLSTLRLEQFRSYGDHAIDLTGGNVHVFTGPNGAGKTNILEAISVLSLTKSCLGADDEDVVSWGKDFYRVTADAELDDGTKQKTEVVSQFAPRRQKACFVNDVRRSIGETVGALPTVVFLPQDLELFTGPPANRRAFLDRLLSQVSPGYLATLLTYQKVMKQRNTLLKHIAKGHANEGDLLAWDMRAAETGAEISLKRLELIEMLQCTLGRELLDLSEKWPDARIVYERSGVSRDALSLRGELLALLHENHARDILLQSTSVGPHRDDWHIAVDGRSIALFASRGQQRTAVLALLTLQVSYLELRRGERPIILLDDVFSELDATHEHALLSTFSSHQTLITTTHAPELLEESVLWNVVAGNAVRAKVALKR